MEEQQKFFILGDIHVPTFEELQKHFKENFDIVNGQLVSKVPQPVIVDYIGILK